MSENLLLLLPAAQPVKGIKYVPLSVLFGHKFGFHLVYGFYTHYLWCQFEFPPEIYTKV